MMKKLLQKILCVTLVAVICGVFTGCNPKEEIKQFSVSFKGFGPGYVSLMVTVPAPTTVSYIIAETEIPAMSDAMLRAAGKEVVFYNDGEQQLLDYELKENTHYYVYLVGVLGEANFSKMYMFEFETGAFTYDQLATVVAVSPDGYKMHLKMPSTVTSTKHGEAGSRGIRWAQSNLMMYNLRSSSSDDYEHLLWNGGNSVREDITLVYSDASNIGQVGYDANDDGVIDENDTGMLWNPIAPGEPVVFIAGEFEWMQEPWWGLSSEEKEKFQESNHTVNGFFYPAGWDPGYYLPCVDSAKYWSVYTKAMTKGAGIINDIDKTSDIDAAWTGAFQRKIFRTRVPGVLDASFNVTVEDLRSVDATVRIEPDQAIYRYLFSIMDDASYQYMLDLLDGREEYVQWAITSYFAMMEFGAMEVTAGTGETSAPVARVQLSNFFYDVPAETKYHVLVTGMSGDIGSPQCFHHHIFHTPKKTKTTGPEIEVTAVPELTSPYTAVFNVKCTSTDTNPIKTCYYGANYYKDWVLDVNSGSSYETLGQSAQFTEDEIDQINSEDGYMMYIPSIDGAKTRLVVVAFNDENVSNGVDTYEDVLSHPAVDDCVTPYAEAEDISINPLLDPVKENGYQPLLNGDWTLTATVSTADGKVVEKSKVTIKNALVEGVDYPVELPDSVLAIYRECTKWTDEEIRGYFTEFKTLAATYNEKRLRNQNKLVLEGWLDNDSEGRLGLMTPWDLFISREINTVDVESLFTEYGPKMYIKVNKDKNGVDSLAITANKYYASPVANWSVPFYMAGYADQDTNNTLFYYGTTTEFQAPLEFGVELSEDMNTLTIRGFEANGVTFYPNVIGVDESSLSGTYYILEKPIVSDVVLTRGWTEPDGENETAQTRAWGRRASSVSPLFKPNLITHSKRTRFEESAPVVDLEYKVVPYETLLKNLEKYKVQK